MSYLDLPRLNFTGRFTAKASTINNRLSNFDPSVTSPDPGWLPGGDHSFTIDGCRVTSFVDSRGKTHAKGSPDPLIGAAVCSVNRPVAAKMVDLDPDQQLVSQIFGLRLAIEGSKDWVALRANVAVIYLADYWLNVWYSLKPPRMVKSRRAERLLFTALANEDDTSPGVESYASGRFQSTMDPVRWDVSRSPLLKSLMEAAGTDGPLSIRFVLDGYEARPNRPDSYSGRIVGSIGPAGKNEPRHTPPGRFLGFANALFNKSYAVIDESRKTLTIDLANSLPVEIPGGTVNRQLVALRVAARIKLDNSVFVPPTADDPLGYATLGTIDDWDSLMKTQGGIAKLVLTNKQLALARASAIALFAVTGDGLDAPAVWEHSSGMAVALEPAFLRLNPGESRDCRLRVTRFGRPVAGIAPELKLVNSELPMIAHANQPASSLELPAPAPTGTDGWTAATIRASAPTGKPTARQFIDGQVYFVGGDWQAYGQAGNFLQAPPLAVLVFDDFQVPDRPQWDRDIKPILINYARLFPIMKDAVGIDLINIDLIKKYARDIIASLQLVDVDESDPDKQAAFMPPSRDLSAKKRGLLVKWLTSLNAPKGTP